MSHDTEVQTRIKRIETLVRHCDAISDPVVRRNVRELLEALLELHATALDRLLTLVSERETEVPGLIDRLAQDQFVGHLLILHGLHPVDLETRAEGALAGIESILRGYGVRAEIVGVPDGAVRVHVRGASSGAVANATRAAIEEALSEKAPDAASIVILGLEQFNAPNFIALDQIRMAQPAVSGSSYAAVGGD
jgi:hypothetical protein